MLMKSLPRVLFGVGRWGRGRCLALPLRHAAQHEEEVDGWLEEKVKAVVD